MSSKQAIRKLIAERVSAVSPSSIITQSERIANVLLTTQEYQQAQKIAVYLQLEKEVQTDAIIKNALRDGKQVFLPQIVPLGQTTAEFPNQKTHLRMLETKTQADIDALVPQGKYRIREPQSGEDALAHGGLDLIIVPGVAFTTQCQRLGHGKGYYDSYISEHFKKVHRVPKLVAVALTEQLVDAIPVEAHDKEIDQLIIGDGRTFTAPSKTTT